MEPDDNYQPGGLQNLSQIPSKTNKYKISLDIDEIELTSK